MPLGQGLRLREVRAAPIEFESGLVLAESYQSNVRVVKTRIEVVGSSLRANLEKSNDTRSLDPNTQHPTFALSFHLRKSQIVYNV